MTHASDTSMETCIDYPIYMINDIEDDSLDFSNPVTSMFLLLIIVTVVIGFDVYYLMLYVDMTYLKSIKSLYNVKSLS